MLLILKLPVVYLCSVVWWAIKAEPEPEQGDELGVLGEPDTGPDWWRRARGPRRPQRGGPHGPHKAARAGRPVVVRGRVERR